MLARPTGYRRRAQGVKTMRWILLAVLLACLPAHAQKTEKAVFAAGCFWCTEEAFEHVPGVVSAVSFYPAEDYHQDYYKKNPLQYKFYVTGCGRYARLDSLWGDLRAKH